MGTGGRAGVATDDLTSAERQEHQLTRLQAHRTVGIFSVITRASCQLCAVVQGHVPLLPAYPYPDPDRARLRRRYSILVGPVIRVGPKRAVGIERIAGEKASRNILLVGEVDEASENVTSAQARVNFA
jgi:hypothetical protein